MPVGEDLHRLEIVERDEWAATAAEMLADHVGEAIEARGQCIMAISGGTTPILVFEALAAIPLDWERLVLVQADERLVPPDSPDRNLAAQQAAFAGLPVLWLPLPVDEVLEIRSDGRPGGDQSVERVLAEFAGRLFALADDPAVIDVGQLGLGADGHTASLFADDPALDELRSPVALVGEHAGHERLTLTRPVFDRARAVVWLVRGTGKSAALGRLLAGDLSLPAGLIRPARSLVVADSDAARQA